MSWTLQWRGLRGEKPASGIDPTAASRSYWERELIAPGSKHSGHYFCVTQCAGKWGGPCCTHCVCAVCQLGSKGERQGRLPIDSPIISLHIVIVMILRMVEICLGLLTRGQS